MTELRIIRGADISLFANQTPLFGVTAFDASRKRRYHDVYEYGSSVPVERVPQHTYYELKLSMMALFDKQLPDTPFALRVVDGDTVYRFERCRITDQKTELKGSGRAEAVFDLEAEEMKEEVAV